MKKVTSINYQANVIKDNDSVDLFLCPNCNKYIYQYDSDNEEMSTCPYCHVIIVWLG
jgi:uncharacterized C2H2 Zn-finger protein